MDEEQRDACLIEIRITMARMRTDIYWLKRILTAAAILVAAMLGIQLPDIFIHE
jgi:hypothetical protein